MIRTSSLLLSLLVAVPALAQAQSKGDEDDKSRKEKIISRLTGRQPDADAIAKVHPNLAAGLADKIRVCFRKEKREPMDREGRGLLKEYAASLAIELESGYASTGCKADKKPTGACLIALTDLDCDVLAEAIKARGWHRNLTPGIKAMIARYTGAVTRRNGECREARGGEVDPSRLTVEADRMGVLAQMMITTGQCQLDVTAEPGCQQRLRAMPCSEVDEAAKNDALLQMCFLMLRCKNVLGDN